MPISELTKTCSKCFLTLELNNFNKSKTSKLGVRGDCKKCQAITNKLYYKKNNEKLIKHSKNFRENNKEYFIKYRLENKKKHREYINQRYNNDELFKLKLNTRNLIKNSFKKNGYSKNSKTYEILGSSFDEFKKHIESLWSLPTNLDKNGVVWMNWGNYGNPKDNKLEPNKTWDIDHIIPLNTAKNKEDVITLNHYSNLQPLCSHYNRTIKKRKYAIL